MPLAVQDEIQRLYNVYKTHQKMYKKCVHDVCNIQFILSSYHA